MEYSFYDTDEPSKQQLDSTALEHDDQSKENEKNEWKCSPIIADATRSKTLRRKNEEKQKKEFKSPLKTQNLEESTSMDPKLEMSADLSSFIANNSVNHFDSILLTSLHKSINFSPRVVFSQESCSQQKDGEKFQWSVEQLAILKPAHISEDEIAASYRSPVPEVEEKIQEVLNEYWTNNVSYIPSPDGPRLIHLPHRDGTVTTIKCGEPTSSEGATPSLLNMVRKKEAVKAAYATSSPKQRPRRNLKQMRNHNSQTELTIPPTLDVDIRKLLGDAFIYQKDEEEEDEEVFNVSVCSNFSTRRRLFSDVKPEGEEEEANEEEQLNNTTGEPFNDSLSPVRRSEDVTEEIVETDDPSTSSAATRSHASQLAINISILNDCMMQSMDEEDVSQEKEQEEDVPSRGCGAEEQRREEHHFHSNEYEMEDRSTSSNATPRHEDLDWTPRRIGSLSIPGSASSRPNIAGHHSELRRFMFDMSPIHPHTNTQMARTPIQRCHLRGFVLNDSDGHEEDSD